ncbi:MAG: AraC family transcriptional regulator [Bacteroidales bacterium]|nr:AraC family transcriptional regulator [Bacteroidales bacterium]
MGNPESKHLKYLAVSQHDRDWGLAVNSVGFQDIAPGAPYPPGDHPSRYVFNPERGRILAEYQLVYITRGHGRFSSRSMGRNMEVKEGMVLALFPGEWHSYRPDSSSGWKEYWIGFQGKTADNWLENKFLHMQKAIFDIGLRSDVVRLYDEAITLAEEGRSGFQQTLGSVASHILSLAYYYDRNKVFHDSGLAEKIEQAKVIISSRLSDISPEEIARELFMSYSGFRRAFKQYTGFSPAKYILDARFSKAKEELTNTDLPIKDIAWSNGFANYEYFLTSFKHNTGMTPREYRKMTTGNA